MRWKLRDLLGGPFWNIGDWRGPGWAVGNGEQVTILRTRVRVISVPDALVDNRRGAGLTRYHDLFGVGEIAFVGIVIRVKRVVGVRTDFKRRFLGREIIEII